jgi:hypothetical protein
MSLLAHCHLLHLRKWNKRWAIICYIWEKKQKTDDKPRRLIVICYTWKNKNNDDEPPRSSSFSTLEGKKKMTMSEGGSSSFATSKKKKKMRTSLLVHRHLLHLRKKKKDDNEPGSSSSSFAVEEKTKRLILSLHFSTSHFVCTKSIKEMRTSRKARPHILQPKKNQHQGFFSWVVEDNDELENSSSSSRFLCFFFRWIIEDNNEWGSSSLSSALQEKKKEDKNKACLLLSSA